MTPITKMKSKIYKFNLHSHITEIETHDGFIPRFVGMQNDKLMIWVEFDPDRPRVKANFQIVGTGHLEIHDNMGYVGSTIDGAYVWHVYQLFGPEVNL